MSSLSKSVLWDKMRTYYSEMGPSVWQQEIVPLHISSNTFLAEIYVSMIIAHLNDCIEKNIINTEQPFYIMEIGAGHGKFSYYVLHSLVEALKLNQMPPSLIKLVVTDVSQKNIDYCMQHPKLQQYIANNLVDFALYNAENDTQLELMVSGHVIKENDLVNPMFILCNYLFDTLSHDAFQAIDDKLYEVGIEVSEKENTNKTSAMENYFDNLAFKYTKKEVSCDYYEDPLINKTLQHYVDVFERAAFLIPIGGLRCLNNIKKFTKSHISLLLADKGYSDTDLFDEDDDPDIAIHGSMSMMVNIDAIAHYFKFNNGFPLLPCNKNSEFQVAYFCSASEDKFPKTIFNFKQHVDHYSPQDLFSLSYEKDERKSHQMDLDQIIAILQLSRWDPGTFVDVIDQILDKIEDADEEQILTLKEGVKKTHHYFFKLEDSQDLPFDIGRLYYAIDELDLALEMYRESVDLFGQSPDTLYNIALCLSESDHEDQAIDLLKKALQEDPQHQDSKQLLKDLKEPNGVPV